MYRKKTNRARPGGSGENSPIWGCQALFTIYLFTISYLFFSYLLFCCCVPVFFNQNFNYEIHVT